MKVVVCGSRDADPMLCWDAFEARLSKLPQAYPAPLVISGGARGPDAIAHLVAKKLGLRTRTFRADWKKNGHRAGILRNIEMLAEEPDLVIAFWDGESRGTQHTILEAKRRGIPIEVISAVRDVPRNSWFGGET